jgi:hypothetical protein
MSFYIEQSTEEQCKYYERMLALMASLSNLYSENTKPFLNSRIAENLFCRYLGAENLSRGDITADAKKNNIGIGIKTWIDTRYQKIAEFNKLKPTFERLSDEDVILKIAEYRNERIDFTMRVQNLDSLIYHCTERVESKIFILESPMDKIDISQISSISRNRNTITFTDGISKYAFNTSKSTLYKYFDVMEKIRDIPVDIIVDPYDLLEQKILGDSTNVNNLNDILLDRVYLPLYSKTNEKGKFVPEKNNINIRFANGRTRNKYEVGFPIPSKFRNVHPNFFPSRDESFNLYLPNGTVLCAKTCQSEGKSLMSNPNNALGHWLIDDVLAISPDTLITYEMLELYGVDSVEIEKRYDVDKNIRYYKINFAVIGSYERFMNELTISEIEEDEE